MEDNSLNRKLFAFFDTDGSLELNFVEYAVSLWNFLTVKNIGLTIFLMADIKGKGVLTYQIARKILEEIHCIDDFEKSPLFYLFVSMKNAAEEADTITLDNFLNTCQSSPSLCSPLFTTQVKLRGRVLNPNFWVDLSRKR